MRSFFITVMSFFRRIFAFFRRETATIEPETLTPPFDAVAYYGCPNSNRAKKLQLERSPNGGMRFSK